MKHAAGQFDVWMPFLHKLRERRKHRVDFCGIEFR